MRTASVFTAAFLIGFSGWAAAESSTDARLDAIQQLGQLNGVALACRYDDAVKRMKHAIIVAAPKERVYGQAFDESSNQGFMAFVQGGQQCPGEFDFVRRVEAAIGEVTKAFDGKTPS